MSPGKAITRLAMLAERERQNRFKVNVDALILGIEALQEIKHLQRMDADFKDFKLPSETE